MEQKKGSLSHFLIYGFQCAVISMASISGTAYW